MALSKMAIFYLLLFSAIFMLFILIMQPFEIFFLAKHIPILFPKGIIALKERNLLFLIQILMLLVIIPVYILTFIFSWWYRADNKKSKYDPHLVDHKIAEVIWWGLPFVLVVIVSIITWIKTHELDPYKPIASEKPPLTVEVVALQWKWLFLYPEERIATVNTLHIPAERPVHFRITADAPMNSFWIPRLGGQIYAMPGMETQLHLIANEEGTFRGSSGHISGEGFAKMSFSTVATSEEEHQNWVRSVQRTGEILDSQEYQKLVKPSIGHTVELYRLREAELFRQIIMKYMHPTPEK